jgi:hypothetical protein
MSPPVLSLAKPDSVHVGYTSTMHVSAQVWQTYGSVSDTADINSFSLHPNAQL